MSHSVIISYGYHEDEFSENSLCWRLLSYMITLFNCILNILSYLTEVLSHDLSSLHNKLRDES